jgi:DNA-directed RNA polymerase specialized sigma24 family protein
MITAGGLRGGLMPSEKRKPQGAPAPSSGGPVLTSRSELLAIFGADALQAEEKCLELFQKLVLYFEWNRRPDPEDLAQETFRRGFTRVQQGQKITAEKPESYFYGIAHNLVREGWSARVSEQLDDQEPVSAPATFHNLTREEQLVFLKECLRDLAKEELIMLVAYLDGEGEAWARKAGIPPATLRTRVHRIRKRLERLAMSKRSLKQN